MKKITTRNDVANKAGVSPAVVSYVLNNSNYVSEEKREAVLAAVKELGYYPNYLARGLKTSRSSHFAIICDEIQNEIFTEMEDALYAKGYYVSLCSSRIDDDFVNMLVNRRFEGIFMTSNAFSVEQLNYIAASGIPMAIFKTRKYVGLDSRIVTVAPDFYNGIMKSMEYLMLKGHKRIALIPPVRYKTKGVQGDDFRVRAYVESLEKNGLPVDNALVCTNTRTVETICESIFEMMTKSGNMLRPTACVVGNDYLAAQLIKYLKNLNLRVPQDVAIIGSDNSAYASITSPTLTTISYSKKELAQKVVDKLFQIINGETPEGEYIDVSLVIGGSA